MLNKKNLKKIKELKELLFIDALATLGMICFFASISVIVNFIYFLLIILNVFVVEKYIYISSLVLIFLDGIILLISLIIFSKKKNHKIKINDFSPKMRFGVSQTFPLCLTLGIFLTSITFVFLKLYSLIILGSFIILGIILLLFMPDFLIRGDHFNITIFKGKIKICKYEKSKFKKLKILNWTTTYYEYETKNLNDVEINFDEKNFIFEIKNSPYQIRLNEKMFFQFKKEFEYIKSLNKIN